MLCRIISSLTRSLFVLALLLSLSCSVCAQFFDEQFDGSSEIDWLPLEPFEAGERSFVAGDYVITPGTTANNTDLPGFAESDSYAAGRVFGSVSVRTRLAAKNASSQDYWVGVFARNRFETDSLGSSSIFTAISESGTVALSTFDTRLNLDLTDTVQTSLRPHLQDVLVQLDVTDDTAELWAWTEGTTRPSQPLIAFDDLPNYLADTGEVGVFAANHLSSPTTFSFRYFETAPVPEPSGLALLTPAVVGILCLRRKRAIHCGQEAT